MVKEIKKLCVIGSGVMGSGIAAQIANAGHDVLLLDIVPKDADNRNALAEGAIGKMMKTDPAPLMHKRNARRITAGNIEDDLGKIAECDWIIEVVLENLDIKRNLYEKLEQHRSPGTYISSNTSSIPLEQLVEGRSDDFTKNFMITHFFNPPRYLRLLELVTGDKTDPKAVSVVRDFCDRKLGKGVVVCHDTPGFIANRIGAFWLQAGVNEAFDLGLSVEEADAVMSRPVGIPKTGVFGLIDLVGLDLMPHLAHSLMSNLPKSDPYHGLYKEYDLIKKLIETGYTGRKGKGGFYRLNTEGGKKVKESIGLVTGEYAPSEKAKPAAVEASKDGGIRALVTHDDKTGQYAWNVLSQMLTYSSNLVGEIADNVYDIDRAMKLGYNFKKGPFELIDDMGAGWFAEQLQKHDTPVPDMVNKAAAANGFYTVEEGTKKYLGRDGKYHNVPREDGVLLLEDIKLTTKPVKKNSSAALWDIGDGVLCLEFCGKMNALDDKVMFMIYEAVGQIGDGSGDYKALVVYNEGTNFSVGANLGMALFVLNIGLYEAVDGLVQLGQDAYKTLKYAPFPVVSAPSGMALGGGCEILLHSDAVQAHAETYTGLVEVGVGLIPGWGGCKEMLKRHYKYGKFKGPMAHVSAAFEQIGLAKVAKSADEARDMMILLEDDGTTMNRDRLLADAKAKALELAKDYTAPEPAEIPLPGASAQVGLNMAVNDLHKSGKATNYDVVVSKALANVLSGGSAADMTQPLTEDRILELEAEEFKGLIRNKGTVKRIEHMMETGKPLRN